MNMAWSGFCNSAATTYFQPLKHQLYHIKPPFTINIRLWEVFVLGVYYGALESLLIHGLQEKLIVRDARIQTPNSSSCAHTTCDTTVEGGRSY
jgi:hypothetical protein